MRAVPLFLVLAFSLLAAAPRPALAVTLCFGQAPTIVGDGGPNVLEGTSADDVIVGGGGNDIINGHGGTDRICGNLGDDTMSGGSGRDRFDGGGGTDTLSYAAASAAVIVDLTLNLQDTGGGGRDLIAGVENLIGSVFADQLIGDDQPNTIQARAGSDFVLGNEGDDILKGGGGNDGIFGGPGLDTLEGLGGFNQLFGGPDSDALTGGPNDDLLIGEDGDDALDGGDGVNLLDGGAGNDSLQGVGLDLADYALAPGPVVANLALGTASGDGADTLSGIEALSGSRFGDDLVGDGGELNLLIGGVGADSLDGGPGFDFLDGGPGSDTLNGGAGTSDFASYFSAANPIDVDLVAGIAVGQGTDTLTGIEGVEGSSLDDSLTGNALYNFFLPGPGDDVVDGRGNFDLALYDFSAAGVQVNLATGIATGDGTDTLTSITDLAGSDFPDSLAGNAAANFIFGGLEDDELLGAAGNDLLDGEEGNDTLNGGAGTDECLNGETLLSCEATALQMRARTGAVHAALRALDSMGGFAQTRGEGRFAR